MKRVLNFVLVLLCCVVITVVITGCGTTNKFTYPSNAENLIKISDTPKSDLTVAVLPFNDLRENKNVGSSMFLYLIPILSIGKVEYDRPEAATVFLTIYDYDFNATEDLAKAAVTSLKKSGLFKNVYFSYGGDIDNADLVLNTDLISSLYLGRINSYGVSAFAPLLWTIGLPCGTSTDTISLSFNLKNKDNSVWQKNIVKQTDITSGLYYNYGDDVIGFPMSMEECMNDVITDLDQELPNIIKQVR